MYPQPAEKAQNEIFRKMSASQKLKIVSQLYLLGKKLDALKYQKINEPRKTSSKNR